MKTKHLKEMTASALAADYLALTNSSVVFATSGGQMQNKLTQATDTVQSILTGLVVLVGTCVALSIIIKRTPGTDDPREKPGVYHVVGCVAGLVVFATAVIWPLPWVYSLLTQN